MALQLNKKYANLPDLDSAPDVYETPELTDDNSTTAGRARSESISSSHNDFDQSKPDKSGISRSPLPLNEARSHFAPAIIDAQDVDFSDRLTAKRKSYKASSRCQRQSGEKLLQYGELSDEDGESLERKVARLKREIEEIKDEYNRRQLEKKSSPMNENEENIETDVSTLSKALDDISLQQAVRKKVSGGTFVKNLGTGIRTNVPPQKIQNVEEKATYTVTYAPTYHQSHALAKAADFDSRLASIELALGLSPSEVLSLNSNGTTNAILPILDKLQRQISVLSQSSPTSIDAMSRQIGNLIQEAKKLEEARKAAKVAQVSLQNPVDVVPEYAEDSELVAKINALYGTLPTIEKLGPLLPPLLDRLRSLKSIHSDAASTKLALDQVDKDQVEMAEEINKWREGLEKLQKTMIEAETTMNNNMTIMEGWIKSLEEKTMSI